MRRSLIALAVAAASVTTSPAAARTDRPDKPVVFFVGTKHASVDCEAILGRMRAAVADTPVPVNGEPQRFDAKQLVLLAPSGGARNCQAELADGSDSTEGLARRFADWLAKRYSTPVDVVAEGDAGVAVRYALGVNGREGWPKLDIEDVVTLGSPHGTLKQAAFAHPDGTQGTDWSVMGSEADKDTPAASAIAMDAEHKTTYKDGGLTHQNLLDDDAKQHDAHIVYQHGEGKEVEWFRAPHAAERVAYDLVNGVESCGVDEDAASAPGSCSSACRQKLAGWTIEFACPDRDKLQEGVKSIKISSPDALHSTEIPSVPLLEDALPLASARRLAVPVILPDFKIHAGGFELMALENTLDADGLTVGTATLSIPRLGDAVVYGLRVETAGKIKADALEVEALGGYIEAEGITFSAASGLRVDSATLGLPPSLGSSSMVFGKLEIDANGHVSGALNGGKVTIGGITADVNRAQVTDSGFTVGEAKLTLPPYLGNASVRGRNLSWNGKRFSLDEAEADLDFGLAGGNLEVAAHVTFKLLPNGGYEIAGSGRVRAPGEPPFFEAQAAVEVKSIDCDPAPGPCRNAVYLQRAALSIAIGKPIPLGSTGLALRGLSGEVRATQNKPKRKADGTVEGVTYTFTLGADIQTFPNPSVFDGSIKGSLSTDGNFGLSVDGKTLRFIDLHGGLCVLLTSRDTLCDQHIGADHRSAVTGPGAFVDVSASASASYSGRAGQLSASLKASAFGRVVVTGGEPYIDAEVAGTFTASSHSFVLPDVTGEGTIAAHLGRFTMRGGGSVLGIKGTVDIKLKLQGGSGDSSLRVQRAIFIDQNGKYTEENVSSDPLAPGALLARAGRLGGVTPARRLAGEEGIVHRFELAPLQTQTTIVLEADSGSPSLELRTPGGARISIDESGGVRKLADGSSDELDNVYSVTNGVPHTVIAYLPKANPGAWVAVARGVPPGAYRLDVSGAKPQPRLTVARPMRSRPATVTRARRSATISGTLHGGGDAASISLYAGRGGCDDRGAAELLSATVPVRDGRWQYRWKPRGAPAGRYLVRAQLNNGTGPLVSACAANAIVIKASKAKRAKPDRAVAAPRLARALPAKARAQTEKPKRCVPDDGEEYETPSFWVADKDIEPGSESSNERANSTPVIAENDYVAIKEKKLPKLLHYGPYHAASGCKSVAREHRKEVCGKRPFRVQGDPGPQGPDKDRTSCDEYPFASTQEGGKKAAKMGVLPRENSSQGGQFSAFLRRNAVALAQLDGAFYVCVKYKGNTAGTCK